jgi:hypothetical protein
MAWLAAKCRRRSGSISAGGYRRNNQRNNGVVSAWQRNGKISGAYQRCGENGGHGVGSEKQQRRESMWHGVRSETAIKAKNNSNIKMDEIMKIMKAK